MIRKSMRRGALAVGAALVFAACGGGDGGGGGDAVSPDAYASDICSSVNDWVSDVQKLSSDLGQNISLNASPQEGKEALQTFLDDAIASTQTMIDEVGDAGVPDVDQGEEVAQQISQGLERAREVLEDARAQVDDLPTNSPQAFAKQAGQIGTSIQESLGAVGSELEQIEAPELDQAFDENQKCQQIGQ